MREDVCRTFFPNRMAGFPAVRETNFFTFYELEVEKKIILENSLRRKLRLETGISTVFPDFETATPAPRKLRTGAGKFLDRLLCMDHTIWVNHAQQVENDKFVGTQNSTSRSTRERKD